MDRPVLIAGAGGMLGTALQRVLTERGIPFVAPPESDFDITDSEAVSIMVKAFAAANPNGLLVNAAAYTNVERAEDDTDHAYAVNERGALLLAEAARDGGVAFVHVSTDFVFDGAKHGAYTEEDPVNPLSVYGASKLAGEIAVSTAYPGALVVRTAWVFGPNGANFPTKILTAARGRPALRVVTDERGSPTYTVDLAAGILDLVAAGGKGLYHLAGAGSCSRFEMAAEIVRIAGLPTVLEPVTSVSFPTRARRPANSMLDCSRAAARGVVMPHWRDALERFLREHEAGAS